MKEEKQMVPSPVDALVDVASWICGGNPGLTILLSVCGGGFILSAGILGVPWLLGRIGRMVIGSIQAWRAPVAIKAVKNAALPILAILTQPFLAVMAFAVTKAQEEEVHRELARGQLEVSAAIMLILVAAILIAVLVSRRMDKALPKESGAERDKYSFGR